MRVLGSAGSQPGRSTLGKQKQTTKDTKVARRRSCCAQSEAKTGSKRKPFLRHAGKMAGPQTYPCAKVFPRTDRNHPLARFAKRLRISHLRLSYRIKFLSPVFPLR